jgi:hypothetical protein
MKIKAEPTACDGCKKKAKLPTNNPGWVFVAGQGLFCPKCHKRFLKENT